MHQVLKTKPLRVIGAVYTALVAIAGTLVTFNVLDPAQAQSVIAALGALATAVASIYGHRITFSERDMILTHSEGQRVGQTLERERQSENQQSQVAAAEPPKESRFPHQP